MTSSGTLIDQEHDQHDFGMIGGNGLRNLLEDDRLTGFRRRRNQSALSPADWTHQIDNARGQFLLADFELESLVRIERGQVVEQRLMLGDFGFVMVDRFDLEQSEIPLVVFGRTYLAGDGIAGAQVETFDL